jgi:hypothetical protein
LWQLQITIGIEMQIGIARPWCWCLWLRVQIGTQRLSAQRNNRFGWLSRGILQGL